MSSQRSFFNRRLHSLLGVIPVGFFLLEHLYTNYLATKGPQEFIKQVEWLWGIPFLPVLEVFFIFLPLLYHGVYGLYIAFQAKNNLERFGTFRNWMFVLQRITGVVTLVFVTWHVWETRLQVALNQSTAVELTRDFAQLISNDVTFVLYIIAVVSAVFHFCNGMWTFLITWGVTVGQRAQRVSFAIFTFLFFAVSYLGISALVAFSKADFLQHLALK